MPQSRSIGFNLVKYIYIIVLVLSIIASTVLFVVGLYALTDKNDNNDFYENVMKYYGIDELNFEPVFNDANLTYSLISNNEDFNKQNFFGTIMVFVGVISILFEMIALIGAFKESLVITITILIIMVIGTISGLCTINSIDTCTLTTQLLFILLAILYVILLKKELHPRRRSPLYASDVEMNNKGFKRDSIDQKYISIKGGPPPYNEVDQNKNVI